MKRKICLMLVFGLLAACGEPAVSEQAKEPTGVGEQAHTEEELFLQDAYWYLQSDEKDIFTWENGMVEEFCAEEPRKVISPEGLTDIQGRELRRVYYKNGFSTEEDYDLVSLYFDLDGGFVGTDYSTMRNGAETIRSGGHWSGDVSFWLFLEKREMPMDGAQTAVCVLRNTGQKKQTIAAYAPCVMAVEWFQNGKSRGSGLASAAQEIMLRPGEVYVETQTVIPEGWNEHNWMPYVPGTCTVVGYVPLSPEAGGLSVTLSRTATFTIIE